jgi:RNA polymerase sigma-70 factor (ECF subfamily)
MTLAAASLSKPSHFHPAMMGDVSGPVPAVTHEEVSWRDMVSHRDYLVRFAQRKLQDPMLAEDVVHDVFEAVLSGRALFAGRSALRSWLTAVLKNKIVDLIRQRASWDSLDAQDDEEEASGQAIAAIECPHARPDELTEHRQRLSQTLTRITALPASLREVMEKRVLMDLSADEVCEQLAISEENLFVRLHRARKQLLS